VGSESPGSGIQVRGGESQVALHLGYAGGVRREYRGMYVPKLPRCLSGEVAAVSMQTKASRCRAEAELVCIFVHSVRTFIDHRHRHRRSFPNLISTTIQAEVFCSGTAASHFFLIITPSFTEDFPIVYSPFHCFVN
jgi:hypothetical protein